MYPDFARKGQVRVECVATFNQDLEVLSLEVISVTPLQMPIPFEQQEPANTDLAHYPQFRRLTGSVLTCKSKNRD